MNPVTWLILGAAAIAGIGNFLSNISDRQEAKKQSAYDLTKHEAEVQDTLDIIDAELTERKDSDFARATAIERGASAEFTSRMQQTYLGQIQAEHEYVDQISEGEALSGQVRAAAATSGAGQDAILERVVRDTINQKNTFTRQDIDRTRGVVTAQGLAMVEEAGLQADTLRGQYDEGSSFMTLFNTKRQSVIETGQITTDYLKDIYNDAHTYDGWDFANDFFAFANPFADAGFSMASSGLIGGKKNG